MGVNGLWEALKPVEQVKRIEDLKHKKIAVDLATWIYEFESISQKFPTIPKPYIRNLFFRIQALLKNDIELVFVLDSPTVPELKKKYKSSGKSLRYNLNEKFPECIRLLDALGIKWVESAGEGEALCAHLNKIGLVDGVMTSDGDALLYGARNVYRNFKITNPDFLLYDINVLQEQMLLNQKSLIALGLLVGCEYDNTGVKGIGKVHSVNFLKEMEDKDPIKVFREWHKHLNDGSEISNDESKVSKKIREAAMKLNNFPNEDIIKEYMSPPLPENIRDLKDITQAPPDIGKAVNTLKEQLGWDDSKSLPKIIEVASRWSLHNFNHSERQLTPVKIVRLCIKNKVESADILWKFRYSNSEKIKEVTEPLYLIQSVQALRNLLKNFNEAREKIKGNK